jgi:hypothetical protein
MNEPTNEQIATVRAWTTWGNTCDSNQTDEKFFSNHKSL